MNEFDVIALWLRDMDARQARITLGAGPTDAPPPDAVHRGAVRAGLVAAQKVAPKRPETTLDAVRAAIADDVNGYLADEDPGYMLILKMQPGVGKTYLGVATAEGLAAAGKAVLYAGPRHDFFQDVIQASNDQHGTPDEWYEWMPRQAGDPVTGMGETCRHVRAMNTWLARGWPAVRLCTNVCGRSYMHKLCPYYAQQRVPHPIIFGQHAHVVLGHPRMADFDVVIGDESPLNTFVHRWRIPAGHVSPEATGPEDVAHPLLDRLADLARTYDGTPLEGPALLDALGGAEWVYGEAQLLREVPDERLLTPQIEGASDAYVAPYAHVPDLVRLLVHEASLALSNIPYEGRVVVHNGSLILALRHQVPATLPKHVIWLDATANAELYEAAFGRPVRVIEPQVALRGRIYQIWDRMNGIAALTERDREQVDDDALNLTARQLVAQVRRIQQVGGYRRMGVITHKAIRDQLAHELGDIVDTWGHFGGNRGTNQFIGCDALIVAGTPQPPQGELRTLAKIFFADRDRPFDAAWVARDVTYAGHAWATRVSGYWDDDDMAAVLWQGRDAEIIQAAHRSRPISQVSDVWLLTGLPLDELPPTRLMTIRQLFLAPQGVDHYKWDELRRLAHAVAPTNTPLTAGDIAELLGISPTTATKYLNLLVDAADGAPDGWRWEPVQVDGRKGRPPTALRAVQVVSVAAPVALMPMREQAITVGQPVVRAPEPEPAPPIIWLKPVKVAA